MDCYKAVKWKSGSIYESVVPKCKAFQDEWDEGFQEGIQESKKQVEELIKCLIRDNKVGELERVVSDSEYQEKMIKEYGLDQVG